MQTIRALTFNMQFGQRWDASQPDEAPVDLDSTLAAIQAVDADLIFLQEVERVEPAKGQLQPPPNFTRLQAALTDYEGLFAYPPANPEELPFGYGLAIFSKTPLSPAQTIVLPAAEELTFEFCGEEKRPTDRVLLESSTILAGQRLHLLNIHLQAFFMIKATSDEFSGQRDRVAERLGELDGPALLAGDLNVAPGEGTLAQFANAGFQSAQTHCVTWKRMPFVLDHLLHSQHLKVERHEVIASDTSDHEMLVVDFSWR